MRIILLSPHSLLLPTITTTTTKLPLCCFVRGTMEKLLRDFMVPPKRNCPNVIRYIGRRPDRWTYEVQFSSAVYCRIELSWRHASNGGSLTSYEVYKTSLTLYDHSLLHMFPHSCCWRSLLLPLACPCFLPSLSLTFLLFFDIACMFLLITFGYSIDTIIVSVLYLIVRSYSLS